MLSNLLQLPSKVMISNLCQQLSQIGVGVRGKLIVACLLALVLLGGSSCMLFDVLVKVDADHLLPLRRPFLLVLDGTYPERRLLLDLLSRDKHAPLVLSVAPVVG